MNSVVSSANVVTFPALVKLRTTLPRFSSEGLLPRGASLSLPTPTESPDIGSTELRAVLIFRNDARSMIRTAAKYSTPFLIGKLVMRSRRESGRPSASASTNEVSVKASMLKSMPVRRLPPLPYISLASGSPPLAAAFAMRRSLTSGSPVVSNHAPFKVLIWRQRHVPPSRTGKAEASQVSSFSLPKAWPMVLPETSSTS